MVKIQISKPAALALRSCQASINKCFGIGFEWDQVDIEAVDCSSIKQFCFRGHIYNTSLQKSFCGIIVAVEVKKHEEGCWFTVKSQIRYLGTDLSGHFGFHTKLYQHSDDGPYDDTLPVLTTRPPVI